MGLKALPVKAISLAAEFVSNAMNNPNKPLQASAGMLLWGGLAIQSLSNGRPGVAYVNACGFVVCGVNLYRHFRGATEPLGPLSLGESRVLGGVVAATSVGVGGLAVSEHDVEGLVGCIVVGALGATIFALSGSVKEGETEDGFISMSSRGPEHGGEMMEGLASGAEHHQAIQQQKEQAPKVQ